MLTWNYFKVRSGPNARLKGRCWRKADIENSITPNSIQGRRTSAQISSSAFGVAAFERVEKRRR